MSIDIRFFENVTWHFGFEVEHQTNFVKHTHWRGDHTRLETEVLSSLQKRSWIGLGLETEGFN